MRTGLLCHLGLLGLLVVGACAKKDTIPAPTSNAASTPPGATPVVPTNTPDAHGIVGSAELSPVYNVSKIKATFAIAEVNGKDLEVKGKVTGMEQGSYELHYHAPTGCDPMGGEPKDKHLADLGTIKPSATGDADVTFTIKDARLGGMNPVVGWCLVIYAGDKFLSYGKILGSGALVGDH